MTRYLVDSDGLIDYLNGIQASMELLYRLDLQGDILCTCAVTLSEVYAGLDASEYELAERLLSRLEYLDISPRAARRSGEWRYQYRRQGVQLATADCLIAATAYEHQAQLVTDNTRHFPMLEVTVLAITRTR